MTLRAVGQQVHWQPQRLVARRGCWRVRSLHALLLTPQQRVLTASPDPRSHPPHPCPQPRAPPGGRTPRLSPAAPARGRQHSRRGSVLKQQRCRPQTNSPVRRACSAARRASQRCLPSRPALTLRSRGNALRVFSSEKAGAVPLRTCGGRQAAAHVAAGRAPQRAARVAMRAGRQRPAPAARQRALPHQAPLLVRVRVEEAAVASQAEELIDSCGVESAGGACRGDRLAPAMAAAAAATRGMLCATNHHISLGSWAGQRSG